ncbi:MAG: hypothetical protein GC136_07350 [Alphaproteobacteria bacterium]|nr:hypothetical protein [Alphaproteobacteria bacterium]
MSNAGAQLARRNGLAQGQFGMAAAPAPAGPQATAHQKEAANEMGTSFLDVFMPAVVPGIEFAGMSFAMNDILMNISALSDTLANNLPQQRRELADLEAFAHIPEVKVTLEAANFNRPAPAPAPLGYAGSFGM